MQRKGLPDVSQRTDLRALTLRHASGCEGGVTAKATIPSDLATQGQCMFLPGSSSGLKLRNSQKNMQQAVEFMMESKIFIGFHRYSFRIFQFCTFIFIFLSCLPTPRIHW